MSPEFARPRLFVYSLLLPLLWFGLGVSLQYLAHGKRLGTVGLFIIIYVMVAAISWHFARTFKRQFSRAERLKLVVYCTIWAGLTEMLALYSLVADDATAKVLGNKMLFGVAVGTVMLDALFMWLGFTFLSKRLIESFLKKVQPVDS